MPEQPSADNTGRHERADSPPRLPSDAAGRPLVNSAGDPFTNSPGRIWSVEDYYRAKELYDKHGAVFNPALEAGSPAAYHVITQHYYQATAPDAQTFGDVFGGLQVKPDNPDGELWRAYSDIIVACDLLGGDQKEALRKVRAKVCQYHDIDVVQANTMPMSQFATLWKAIGNAGRSLPPQVDKTGLDEGDLPQFILDRLRAGDAIITAEEVALWPAGILDQLLADGSLQPTDNARSIACDACGRDHVEEVLYVQSPPGSDLRAYIPCPELGRTQVPLDRLRCWVISRSNLPEAVSSPNMAVPLSPPLASVPGSQPIPHELSVAHATLTATLAKEIESYKRNVRFPNPKPVLDTIERFVHELKIVPNWFTELEWRVSLVENTCATGTDYDLAKHRALDTCPPAPQELCRGKLAIERLCSGKANPPPCFLAEVVGTRQNIEAILEEPSLGLAHPTREAFVDLCSECIKVQREAERLEVDGCWYLYHIYLSAEPGCSERSQTARAIMQTDMGGVNLDPMKAAAESMMAWVAACGPQQAPVAEPSRSGESLATEVPHVTGHAPDAVRKVGQVTIGRGEDSLVLQATDLSPFSVPTSYSELFKLFAAKVACGSPCEIVGLAELNHSVGVADSPETKEKASSLLRTAIKRLNDELGVWATPSNQEPWIGARRGQGYCLNSGVGWSIGDPALAKELTRYCQSVWDIAVSPATLAENTPLKDQRLPAKSRYAVPSDDEENC